MAHYDIFRQSLTTKYSAYGHALWEPNPGGRYPAVAVGDVGFVREGRFHRLFNVLLRPDDSSHRIFGVPEDSEDEQLRPHVEDHITTGTLSPNHFCSAGVTLEPESEINANDPRTSTVSFSCRKKQGAVLSLPMQARCQDTVALGDFRKWMIDHIDRWYSWARELGVGINRMEDIVLVTGAHLTKSWINVAFLEEQTDARVSFEYRLGADTGISWHVSPHRIIGAHLNCGPIGEDLPEDQCIFIRGYRITRKLMILPRTFKGAAGPNPDSKGSDSEPEMEVVPISTVPEYRDPLHLLLEYIAESALECDMILVHDDDLARLDVFGGDNLLDSLLPDALATHLRHSKPEIREVLFHPDQPSGSRGANADTGTGIRVAMLSGSRTFEGQSPLVLPTSSRQRLVTGTRTIPSNNPATSLTGQPETPADILVDGFIARTFASEGANDYLMLLLRAPSSRDFLRYYGIINHRGAWYISHNSNLVQGTSPGVQLSPTPLLDYSMRTTVGTVVPQRRWSPADEVGVRRHVESASLQLPIFFEHHNGGSGFRLPDILRGGYDPYLSNAGSFAPLGGRATTCIRINWPGYGHWSSQISTRDQTPARNPITMARFMKHVGTTVDKFFRENMSNNRVSTDPRWWIGGAGGITQEEVKLVGAINVSSGSWMPILQLTRYVI